MKKLIMALVCAVWVLAVSAHDFTFKNINYTVIDNDARTCRTAYTPFSIDSPLVDVIALPSTVSDGQTDYTVVEIGDSTFFRNRAVKFITLPSTVRRIGRHVFARCLFLRSVSFPEGLTEIGDSAFYRCDLFMELPELQYDWRDSVPRCVTLPEGVTRIGKGAFQYCRNFDLTNLPTSLTEISDYSFAGASFSCDKLVIPEGVTKIGMGAFWECAGLMCLTEIPRGVKYIGASAFRSTWLQYLTMPPDVVSIEANTFEGCRLLTSITLPRSLVSINNSAFKACRLESLELPETVTWIGDSAFSSHTSYADDKNQLRSISLPNSIYHIGRYAFYDCALTSVTLPSSLEAIREGTFHGCKLLRGVSLPNLYFIGGDAFRGCTSLESLRVPSSVKKIGEGFVAGCTSLGAIEVDPDNQCYVDIDGVLYDRAMTLLLSYPGGKGDAVCDIPSTVKEIGACAFLGNPYIERVRIPEGVVEIKDQTFYECSSLSDAPLPRHLKRIGYCSFRGCALREVTIPESVTDGGSDAFEYNQPLETLRISGQFEYIVDPCSGCPNISQVYYLTDSPQTNCDITYYSFVRIYFDSRVEREGTLYVLESAYDEIKNGNLEPWSEFRHIEVYDPANDPGGIDEVGNDGWDALPTEVYTLGGMKVGSSTNGLPAGLYILRRGSHTEKIMVR